MNIAKNNVGESIILYVPSLRMRTLFKKWLNSEKI